MKSLEEANPPRQKVDDWLPGLGRLRGNGGGLLMGVKSLSVMKCHKIVVMVAQSVTVLKTTETLSELYSMWVIAHKPLF